MIRRLFLATIFLTAFLKCTDTNSLAQSVLNNSKIAKFELVRDERDYFHLVLLLLPDSIVGEQCFTFDSGGKIDCCLDGHSLFLKRAFGNNYEGVWTNCYNEETCNVAIQLFQDSLKFKIMNGEYLFLDSSDVLVFTRIK